MSEDEKFYNWSIKEVVYLKTELNSIKTDVKIIKGAVIDRPRSGTTIKDTFNDWKTLVIAALTIIGAIIALRQGV